MLLAHMTLTDKPHLGAISDKSPPRKRSNGTAAVRRRGFDQHCVILGNVNTNSPLLVDKVVTEAAEVYCGAGQGIIAVPFILPARWGP